MTYTQVCWARSHDWFLTYKELRKGEKEYKVIVRNDMENGEPLEFQNFKALKVWAGY